MGYRVQGLFDATEVIALGLPLVMPDYDSRNT